MGYNLQNWEKETIIRWDNETKTASIYTCCKSMMNKMDKLMAKSKGIALKSETNYSREYECPSSWIKVHAPKVYSEEQRQKMAMAARERFAKFKNPQ